MVTAEDTGRMARDEALRCVLAKLRAADGVVFTSNGNNSRAAYALDDRALIFYAMGSMGQCAPLAAGFSSAADAPVAAIDGDGAVAMGLAGLAMVTRTARRPFVHVVLDNGCYETTGGQRVPVPDTLLTAAAQGAGYSDVVVARSASELAALLDAALTRRQLAFILVPIARSAGQPQHPRVPHHPREITARFARSYAERRGAAAASR